jgi:hypothetical protein
MQALVVIEIPCPVDPKIPQHTRFRADTDIEEAEIANWRDADCHLPAMHFPGNAHGEHGYLACFEIIKPLRAKVPLWS